MEKPTIKAKKRLLLFLFCSMCGYLLLTGRLVFIELFRAEELQELAYEQQTRDRLITPKRGAILDRNGDSVIFTSLSASTETPYFGSCAVTVLFVVSPSKVTSKPASESVFTASV